MRRERCSARLFLRLAEKLLTAEIAEENRAEVAEQAAEFREGDTVE
jgi:hypothetical protein